MFPLSVILIGCRDQVLTRVREELAAIPANVENEFAHFGSVVNNLSIVENEKKLFVAHVRSFEELEYFRWLTGIYLGHPFLALIDDGQSPANILATMRAGAAQVVPLPLDTADFRAAMGCISGMFGYPASKAKVIAVSGATGGCGATTIAINIAYEIARAHGLHTVLVELALQMGVLSTYLDLETSHTTYDLFCNMSRVDMEFVKKALRRYSENLDVLPGPDQLNAPLSISTQDVVQLVDYCRRIGNVVVLDLPCTFDKHYFDTLSAVDQVVLVAEQKLPSIRAMQSVIEMLQRETGYYTQHLVKHLVINRYNSSVKKFTVKDLLPLMGAPSLLTVANDSKAVMGAVNNGRPLRLENAKSKTLADIETLVKAILEVQGGPNAGTPKPQTGSGLGKFFSSFLGSSTPKE